MRRYLLNIMVISILTGIPSLIPAQSTYSNSLSWSVEDRDFSREFLRNYLDELYTQDPTADTEIQETDQLLVQVQIGPQGGATLEEATVVSRGGAYNTLSAQVLDSLDQSQVQALVQRRYAWDYLSGQQLNKVAVTGEIINVFQERNNKQVRDAFWWTHRRMNLGALSHGFLRIIPKWAFMYEFGRQDLGYPAGVSKTTNVGLATEIFKVFATFPVPYLFEIGGGGNAPLEGSYGGGLKFDTPRFGGSVSFQDMLWRSADDVAVADSENVVYNEFAGQVFYSFTQRIGTDDEDAGLHIPVGSMRIKIGVSYIQMVYGNSYINDADEFRYEEQDRTDRLNNIQAMLRAEYASEMNERYFNAWKFMTQLNVGVTGAGGVQIGLSRTLIEWLSVDLMTAFYWSGIEFTRPDNEPYNWNPGWYIIPTVSINL